MDHTHQSPSWNLANILPTSLTRWIPLATIVVSTFIFDGLFWERSIGLNLTLFAGWSVVFLLLRYGFRSLTAPAKVALFGTLIAASMVYLHHSTMAIFSCFFALSVFVAFAHEHQLRSVLYAVPQTLTSFVLAPFTAWEGLDALKHADGPKSKRWGWFKVALIPLLIGILFFQLYRAGNPKFDELTAGFLEDLFELIDEFFTPHVFFLILAFSVSAVVARRVAPRALSNSEQHWTDALFRKKTTRAHWLAPRAMDPLERERRGGVVLLVIMNAMLLVVNMIDINWVWFGFTVPEGFSLKQFVHNGTWMLIVSILLSMVILIHLFRGNLNFYTRSGSLKWLGAAWIIQNFILGISVFLRNYHYISFHGLAYKRIGVIVFLVLVLIGLITLFMKVRKRKSFFYLARVNSWALFVVLIGISTVDWDSFIVRHNLDHPNKGEIDIDNYLSLSDKVLPLLYANLEVVEAQMAQHSNNNVRWVYYLKPDDFRRDLDAKRDAFQRRYEQQYWQESSLADDATMVQLNALQTTE